MKSGLSLVLLGFIVPVLFSGCRRDNITVLKGRENRTNAFSTEMYPNCWFNDQTLQRKIVHSGEFASRVDSNYPYSFGFKQQFAKLDSIIPRRVDVGFWLYAKDKDISAALVVSIDSVEKNTFWTSVGLKDSLKKSSEWQQIHCSLTLPKRKIRPDDKISIYVWDKDSREFFVDDFTVKFEY